MLVDWWSSDRLEILMLDHGPTGIFVIYCMQVKITNTIEERKEGSVGEKRVGKRKDREVEVSKLRIKLLLFNFNQV